MVENDSAVEVGNLRNLGCLSNVIFVPRCITLLHGSESATAQASRLCRHTSAHASFGTITGVHCGSLKKQVDY